MATHTGSSGILKIAGNAIAELKSWDVSESAGQHNTTTMGSTAETYTSGLTSWTGSCECFLDEGDTAQGALTSSAQVTVAFYFDSAATKYYEGTANVESVSRSGGVDGMVEASFSLRGTGVLELKTV